MNVSREQSEGAGVDIDVMGCPKAFFSRLELRRETVLLPSAVGRCEGQRPQC
jgi:hypothetical protein